MSTVLFHPSLLECTNLCKMSPNAPSLHLVPRTCRAKNAAHRADDIACKATDHHKNEAEQLKNGLEELKANREGDLNCLYGKVKGGGEQGELRPCVIGVRAEHRTSQHSAASQRVWGCESAQGIVQASAGRELSYMGLLRLRTRRYRMARAARECGEVGDGNGAGWSQVVGNGRTRFGTARNFVEVATGVGNASALAPWGTRGMNHTELKSPKSESTIRSPRCKVVITWLYYPYTKESKLREKVTLAKQGKGDAKMRRGVSGMSGKLSAHRARESGEVHRSATLRERANSREVRTSAEGTGEHLESAKMG
ncbi:hypothetical protein EDB85DRAFT_2230834 [Lactarius pseudohatsudake]|nr:hypothetical protein EDB85DRAFT_2230834 [Lactarius pseudohatsudake]